MTDTVTSVRLPAAAAGLTAMVVLLPPHATSGTGELFDSVSVHLERNVTDNDAEAIFEVATGGAGISALEITAPGERKLISFEAPDSKLGVRHVSIETPEPKNVDRILADFPAGTYHFSAMTVSGGKLHGQAELNHDFVAGPVLLLPKSASQRLPLSGALIQWAKARDVQAWIVAVGQEETGREVRANLPADASAFPVPDGFLLPDTEYKIELGAVGKTGNASFVEIDVRTLAAR
jgi:hypothetical protein